MNSLTRQGNAIAPGLSIQHRAIIEARNSLRLKNIKPVDMEVSIIEAITRVYFRLRFTPPPKADLKIMVGVFITDLKDYAGTLTINELELAFKNGCIGLYGEFKGVSNVTLIKWVMAYMVSDERKEALKKQAEFENPKPVELSQSEKDALSEDAFQSCLRQYKSTGNKIFLNTATYDYLVRVGKLNNSARDKWRAVYEAREAKEKSLKAEREGAKPEQIREINKAIEEITKGKDQATDEAKKILLKEYFDILKTVI